METDQKSIWITSDQIDNFNNYSCAKGIHIWVAIFLVVNWHIGNAGHAK